MSQDIKTAGRGDPAICRNRSGRQKEPRVHLGERGQIVLQEWVVTTPEAFFKRFHGETKMDIAMEVGPHWRWTSDLLRRCGHHLVVADPRQLGLITKSHAKSDKRDARTLAQLRRADPRLLSPLEHRAENGRWI